jgi:hypothetical protein
MTSDRPDPRRHPHRRRRRDRIAPTIAIVATVLGLWLGLEGPSVSPVAPSTAPIGAVGTTIPDPQQGLVGG